MKKVQLTLFLFITIHTQVLIGSNNISDYAFDLNYIKFDENNGYVEVKFSTNKNIQNFKIEIIIPDFVNHNGNNLLKIDSLPGNNSIDFKTVIDFQDIRQDFKIKCVVSGLLNEGKKISIVKNLYFKWENDSYVVLNEKELKNYNQIEKNFSKSINSFNLIDSRTVIQKDTVHTKSAVNSDSLTVKGMVWCIDNFEDLNPLSFALVELVQKIETGEKVLIETLTDSEGKFNIAFVPHSDNINSEENTFIRVSTVGAVKSLDDKTPIVQVLDDTFKEPYFSISQLFAINPSSSNKIDLELMMTESVNQGATNVFQSIIYGWEKTKEFYDITPTESVVIWPASHSITNDTIYILHGDRYDRDVILHEYGHFIDNNYGLSKNPGGDFYIDENLSERYPDDYAKNLAWSEGWAMYFAVSLQFADTKSSFYTDTEDIEINFNLEGPIKNPGEDCAGAVACILWDIFDNEEEPFDKINLGLLPTWSIISKNAPVSNISEFLNHWNESANGYNDEIYEIYKEYTNITTDIEPNSPEVELTVKCYPNPFKNEITIEYTLSENGFTQIDIYNIQGNLITTLVTENQNKYEKYAIKWDGTNSNRTSVTEGIYYVVFKTANQKITKTILLIN